MLPVGLAPSAPLIKSYDFEGKTGSITVTAPSVNISGEAVAGAMTLALVLDGGGIWQHAMLARRGCGL